MAEDIGTPCVCMEFRSPVLSSVLSEVICQWAQATCQVHGNFCSGGLQLNVATPAE